MKKKPLNAEEQANLELWLDKWLEDYKRLQNIEVLYKQMALLPSLNDYKDAMKALENQKDHVKSAIKDLKEMLGIE